MKKLAALMFVALAAFTAHAGYELRSTLADSEGYFTMSLVDSKTGEIVDQKRFQYQLDDTGVDYLIVDVDKAPAEEVKDAVGSSDSVSSVPDVSDASATIDGSDDNSPSLPATEEVGVWDAVKKKLEASQAALSKALEKLQEQYASLGSDQPAEEKVYQEILHVEKVAHETETTDVVDGSEAREDSETILDQEAEVTLPK